MHSRDVVDTFGADHYGFLAVRRATQADTTNPRFIRRGHVYFGIVVTNRQATYGDIGVAPGNQTT